MPLLGVDASLSALAVETFCFKDSLKWQPWPHEIYTKDELSVTTSHRQRNFHVSNDGSTLKTLWNDHKQSLVGQGCGD